MAAVLDVRVSGQIEPISPTQLGDEKFPVDSLLFTGRPNWRPHKLYCEPEEVISRLQFGETNPAAQNNGSDYLFPSAFFACYFSVICLFFPVIPPVIFPVISLFLALTVPQMSLPELAFYNFSFSRQPLVFLFLAKRTRQGRALRSAFDQTNPGACRHGFASRTQPLLHAEGVER